MTHWHLRYDELRIARLTFDQADASVNTLSSETLEELGRAMDMLEATPPAGLIVCSAKPGGFIAGADVKGFAGLTDTQVAQAHIHSAHALLARLEALPCPSVALIHGHCLGGGLELALACHHRLATDDPKTRLGFPEVRLGIFPGFGGTVRAPARIGHLAALELMLTGRAVDGRAAKRLGLVDDCVPQRQLESAALAVLRQPPAPRRPALLQRLAGWPGMRGLVARQLRKQTAAHADPAHYPAPHALIEHWRRHTGDPAALYGGEADTVARLLSGDTAQNLIRVFLLQEGLKARADKNVFVPRHLHVVGAGVMGGDIAAWGALHGLGVSLQDRNPEQLARALGRARALFAKKLKTPRLVTQAMDRLMPDPAGAGVARADVLIEAIVEEAAAKRALFAELVPRMKSGALLATNTSSIPLEVLGEGLPHPETLVGLHFFNPVAKMPLLEIVRGPGTDPVMVDRALAFARHIDKLPLPVASRPGFLVNRILMPYLLEAVALVEEGATPEAVDRAATAFGMPMGPVELADSVGLDICLAVAGKLGATLPASLQNHVAAGRLGRKSGQGYYRWRGDKPARGDRTGFSADQQDRLLLRLINEAVACLREGVVDDADALDAGVVFGAGFAPYTGGPLHYLRHRDPAALHARLVDLARRHGERFAPDPGWARFTGAPS